MHRSILVLLATWAASSAAAEVTIFRPTAFIATEWSYYVMLDDQPITDVRSGERVTFQIPPGARSLAIHCPKAGGTSYAEKRIEHDFRTSEPAFFALTARSNCVAVEKLDAKAAGAYMRRTNLRLASRPIDYEKHPVDRDEPVAVSAVTPPATPASIAAEKDAIAAATNAWVEAFNSRDPGRISALYDAEAVLTDASEPRARVGAAEIAEYYKKAAQRPTQRVALGERNLRLLGDTAIDSGTLTYFEMRDGNATTTPGRYSLTYHRRGGKWMIVDQQLSTTPR
jgi:uncharacterized protein (TIGR02246 family)